MLQAYEKEAQVYRVHYAASTHHSSNDAVSLADMSHCYGKLEQGSSRNAATAMRDAAPWYDQPLCGSKSTNVAPRLPTSHVFSATNLKPIVIAERSTGLTLAFSHLLAAAA